jgi:putative transposase
MALFTWIKAWYNPRRRHGALDDDLPLDFEARHRQPVRQRQTVEHGLPTVGACVV